MTKGGHCFNSEYKKEEKNLLFFFKRVEKPHQKLPIRGDDGDDVHILSDEVA